MACRHGKSPISTFVSTRTGTHTRGARVCVPATHEHVRAANLHTARGNERTKYRRRRRRRFSSSRLAREHGSFVSMFTLNGSREFDAR